MAKVISALVLSCCLLASCAFSKQTVQDQMAAALGYASAAGLKFSLLQSGMHNTYLVTTPDGNEHVCKVDSGVATLGVATGASCQPKVGNR